MVYLCYDVGVKKCFAPNGCYGLFRCLLTNKGENVMRGIETPITKLRRQVFTEVARVAFESDNIPVTELQSIIEAGWALE